VSTNSSITVKQGKIYKNIYCHWDGYPSYNGKMLLQHYNSQEGADSLVDNGNISTLKESVACPEGHSFETPADKHTVFYGRDRGEENQEAKVFDNFKEAIISNSQEYDYYWDGEKWWVDNKILTQEIINND